MIILYVIFITYVYSFYCENHMDHIYKNLYLGDHHAAENENLLKMYDIKTVINCAAELRNNYKDLISFDLNLYDMPEERIISTFERTYEFVKKHLNNNIFVHCYMGISRSSSFVIFYLMKEEKWDYEKCYDFVKKKRSCIDPNYGFQEQLKNYYNNYIKNN